MQINKYATINDVEFYYILYVHENIKQNSKLFTRAHFFKPLFAVYWRVICDCCRIE